MRLVEHIQQTQLQSFAYMRNEEVNLSKLLTKQDIRIIEFLYYADYDLIYQSFQMKHAAYLQKKLTNLSRKQMNQDTFRRFNAISQKNHFKLQKMSIKVDRTLSRLQFLWSQRNILVFHRYYFLKYLQNSRMDLLQNIQFFICTEQKLIKTESHIIFSIQRSINAREQCLLTFKKFLNRLGPEDIQQHLYVTKYRLLEMQSRKQVKQYQIHGYKINKIVDKVRRNLQKTIFEQFSQIFNQLTKITLLVIELISQWREYLYSLTSDSKKKNERIEYYYKEDNYLLKIIDDNNFLQRSFLSNYYQFAQKNDPFLLKPVMHIQKVVSVQQSQSQIPFQKICLKNIFLHHKGDIPQIMGKIKVLVQQFQQNIKNRKIFDIKTLHWINNLQLQKLATLKQKHKYKHKTTFAPLNSEEVYKHQNFSLKKLSASMKFMQTNKRKNCNDLKVISDAINQPQNQTQKKLLRSNSINTTNFRVKSKQKLRLGQTTNNENRLKQIKNTQFLNHELLQKIKVQIKKKVKQELNLNQLSSAKVSKLFLNPQIADHIDVQVAQMMKKTFYNKFLVTNKKINVLPISIKQDQVDSYISSIMKQTNLKYQFFHQAVEEIRKIIEQSQSIYFLKVTQTESHKTSNTTGSKFKQTFYLMSSVIFKFNFDYTAKTKLIQVIHTSFQTLEQLEETMIKVVQFLHKYEKSSQICFSFKYMPDVQQQKKYMTTLKSYLSKNCLCVQKKVLKTSHNPHKQDPYEYEVKFIFKRKDKLQNDNRSSQSSCLYPKYLHLQGYALLSDEALDIRQQNRNSSASLFNFDYLLSQLFKNHLNSDDFLLLRSQSNEAWQTHLKVIIENILSLKQLQKLPYISSVQARNITQLNRYLSQEEGVLHIKCLRPFICDKTKHNLVKMLKFELNLTVGYMMKAIILGNGDKYHRYQINNYLTLRKYSNQIKVYFLPTYQKKNVKILIADLKNCNAKATFQQILNVCQPFQELQQFVEYLWIPMCRYPQNYTQNQQFFISMQKSKQLNLDSVKKQLLVGHHVEWQNDINLQNGVNYTRRSKDLFFEKPFGMGVCLQPENIVMMSCIFEKSN